MSRKRGPSELVCDGESFSPKRSRMACVDQYGGGMAMGPSYGDEALTYIKYDMCRLILVSREDVPAQRLVPRCN